MTPEDWLHSLYYNQPNPGYLAGEERLAKSSKFQRDRVRKWLSWQDSYTLHRNIRRKFPRMVTIAYGVDERWQADLMDVSSSANVNDGTRFVLVCIDVFSRYAFVKPLEDKKATSVANALKFIFETSKRHPSYTLTTDEGKEFCNQPVRVLLKDYGIKHYTTVPYEIKCAVVERFIRTLREKIARLQTYRASPRYIDHLAKIVKAYNLSTHRMLGFSPTEVSKGKQDVHQAVYLRLFGESKQKGKGYPKVLPIGTSVRIAKWLGPFDKRSGRKLTRETFLIDDVIRHRRSGRPVYKLRDQQGEPVTSVFYPEEVVPVYL